MTLHILFNYLVPLSHNQYFGKIPTLVRANSPNTLYLYLHLNVAGIKQRTVLSDLILNS